MLKIYVISLRTDTERRRLIKSKLDSLRIPFEFIDAVYGKSLSNDFISQLHPVGRCLKRGFPPTIGEVGCGLSHLKLYNILQCSSQEWACILEDDVIFDDRIYSFFANFNKAAKQLNSHSLYLLGGQDGLPNMHLVVKSIFNTLKIGSIKFEKVTYGGCYLARACCYLIHKQLAKNILDLSSKSFLLADDWEFLQNNNVIEYVYLSDFIDHPLDLSTSHLERERQQAEKDYNLSANNSQDMGLLYNIKICLYRVKIYLKFFVIQLYRLKR